MLEASAKGLGVEGQVASVLKGPAAVGANPVMGGGREASSEGGIEK